MINLLEDIRPLTEFKTDTNKFIADLKRTKRPAVLTVNGKAEVAVIDIATFQKMQEELEMQQNITDINRSLKDYEKGRYSPADEAFDRLKKKLRQPKKTSK